MSCLVQSQISTWKPRSSTRRTCSANGSSVKIISAQAASEKSAIIAPLWRYETRSSASTSASMRAKTAVVVV
jgi:hypothetical protein